MIFGISIEQLITAFLDTIYMSFVSLIFSVIFGFIIGLVLYCTKSGGLIANKAINRVVDVIVNIFRSIPFIILLFWLIPFTKMLTGSMLGATAALPSLVVAASPFYARLAFIAFNEIDKGTIEAAKSMGASNLQVIIHFIIKESAPALVSAIGVTAISLISYSTMAGAIGSGGLGNLAYLYGLARRNDAVLFSATLLIVIIVFVTQALTDYIVKKIDHR